MTAEITNFLRSWKPQVTLNTKGHHISTQRQSRISTKNWDYPTLWSRIYGFWIIAPARISLIKICETWKDDIYRRSCPKDRYNRRTQNRRNAVWCSVYNCFCIVLHLYVYFYTQFQNPPYLVECWISLKFTDKTIKNFHLQWDSNPLNVLLLGKFRNLVSRSRTPKGATLL